MSSFVSVIIPTFNAPREFLLKCINSVLEQTHGNLELLVIDDAGDVAFSGLDLEIDDRRVVWIKNSENIGVSQTRNRGISKSRGEWVSFLDADDWWESDKLESQLSVAA